MPVVDGHTGGGGGPAGADRPINPVSVEHTNQSPGARFNPTEGGPAAHPLAQISTLESLLIHIRHMDEFLGFTDGREDDVRALDYFDGEGWTPEPVLQADERVEINKRINHITTRRLIGSNPTGDDNSYSWGRWDIALRTRKVFGRFVGDLKVLYPDRAEWFAATARSVRVAPRNPRDWRPPTAEEWDTVPSFDVD